MLRRALKVTAIASDNVIFVVFSPFRLGNGVTRTVNLVRCARPGAPGLPLNVLEVVRAVDDGHTVLALNNILGDGVINVTGLGAFQIVQFVGHLLQNLQKRDCKVLRTQVVDANARVGGEHVLRHNHNFCGLLFCYCSSHLISSS